MFCSISETEGKVRHLNQFKPSAIPYKRSRTVALLWLSVACFGVRVSVTFHLTYVHFIFSSVCVAKRPPFGK